MDLKTRFTHAITKKRLSHALLFLGSNQTLKEETATNLACGLYCEEKSIPFGCASCITCQLIRERKYPRVRWLISESEIKIDSIRELINAPGEPSWIIPQAHLMNRQASNALLKTLEEPRSNQTIILIAPSTSSLLSTIVSRCQRILFPDARDSKNNDPQVEIPNNLQARLELIEQLSKDKLELDRILTAWQKTASPDFSEALLKAQQDLKHHLNPQLILESLLLSR